MPFSTKLRELRKKQKLTQDELALKVGIHGRHIGKYENGQVMPNAETLIRIAKVFDISIDYLILDAEDPRLIDLQDRDFLRYFKELENMTEKDKEIVKSLIDAYLKKNKLEAILAK